MHDIHDIQDRVRRTIARFGMAVRETRVLAAVSGGPDSVALAHLLHELGARGELTFAGIAHFNHQLRPDAAADEAFVRDLALRLSVPFHVDRGNVAEEARRDRRSIEATARRARHAFLARARADSRADVVALGHTKDDQAETFLLRLLRGAGPQGLGGMHPRRGAIVRPLIDCTRQDVLAYLAAGGLPFVHDATNDDVSIPRNRVRAELLPFLKRFNPAIVERLADEADIVRETWKWMDAQAAMGAPDLCRPTSPGEWTIDAATLAGLPTALARHLVHKAMTEASGGRTVTLAHVDALIGLSRLPNGSLDAPGQHVQRLGGAIVLTSRPAEGSGRWHQAHRERPGRSGRAANKFRYPLSIPGEALITELNCAVSAEERPAAMAILGSSEMATIQKRAARTPFSVRIRRPGDRFRPLGMRGDKKLQDFFVDRKIPLSMRDSVPLVVDRDDRIVWVAGHAIDEEFRVTDPAEAVIIFRLKVLGGPA